MARIKKSLGVSARSTRHFLGKRLRQVSFSPHYKRTSQRGRIFAGMVLVGFLLFGSGLFISFFVFLKSSCIDYSSPFLQVFHNATKTISQWRVFLDNGLELLQEPHKYRDIKEQKDTWEARAYKLDYENKRLMKALTLKKGLIQQGYDVKALSQVRATVPSPYGRMVIISGGSPQGLFPKDIIIEEKGLVGRIFDGGDKVSRVLLLTDPRSRIPVVLEPSGYQGIMSGDSTDYPVLSRLEASLSCEEDLTHERVYTSGAGGIFYARIPIGSLFKDASGVLRVKPLVNLRSLDVVGILETLPVSFEKISNNLLPEHTS